MSSETTCFVEGFVSTTFVERAFFTSKSTTSLSATERTIIVALRGCVIGHQTEFRGEIANAHSFENVENLASNTCRKFHGAEVTCEPAPQRAASGRLSLGSPGVQRLLWSKPTSVPTLR